MKKENINKIIIYKDESGKTQIDVKVDKETVWLDQNQIAQLFDIQRPAITKHLSNIYQTNELSEYSTCSILEHVGVTGQKYKTKLYNLDAIISVGYRVNSKRATQFRIWATNTLRNYLLNGYVVNDKTLLEYKDKLALLKETITFIEKKADNYVNGI